MRRALLPIATLVLAGTAAARGDDAPEVEWSRAAALAGSPDPGRRGEALERARGASTGLALAVPIAAVPAVRRDRDAAAEALARAEREIEDAWAARDAEAEKFERLHSPEPAREEAHRRRDEAARARIEEGERKADEASLEVARREEEMDSIRRAAVSILARVEPDDVEPAIRRLASAWLRAGDAADRVRFVESIEHARSPAAGAALREIALDPALDPRPRAAALDARAARRDDGALDDAISLLADPAFAVRATAVDVLRTLHEPQGIEPLIAFLGRDDLGRLREDATRALRSLTGESHGPYREPWAAWWAEARDRFEPPRRPASLATLVAPERGLTFYGITTFSDRVVFVLDTSGSMREPSRTSGRAAPRKIDAARKELFAALDALGEGARFSVVLFDRAARRLSPGLFRADAPSRARAHAWVAAREPRGETNLGDALREAFRLASGLDGPLPPLGGADTVFVLTDGRPTAGGLRSSDRIVEAVRRWNRSARLVVHCVGVGDADAELLVRLSSLTGGQFVRR